MSDPSEKDISEIKSLLKLLDDDDQHIYQTARERLLAHAEAVLPYLPEVSPSNSVMARRTAEIRELITRSVYKEQFRNLKRDENGDVDLEEGVFLIARQRFVQLDSKKYVSLLNDYAVELKEILSSIGDNTEIMRRTISFFVDEKGFTGNFTDYFNENNHYINRVLESKSGIPITLSIVYLLVGKRIDLPLRGIGLPGHFTMRFSFGGTNVYFDPYNQGKILSVNDCTELVKKQGYEFSEAYLKPVTNRQILERMLRNIIIALEKKQETERMETMRLFIDSLNSNV